jgi:hypothetical protein
MKQIDFVLYEFQRRAQQKQEESMIKKIRSAESSNPTPPKNKSNNHNFITPAGAM